ncbi:MULTISPECIES: hypothetical protein [Halorubrum]|nr:MULTISPECIES: hypothetical protein [Halorubrum]
MTLWDCPECGSTVNAFVNGSTCPNCGYYRGRSLVTLNTGP